MSAWYEANKSMVLIVSSIVLFIVIIGLWQWHNHSQQAIGAEKCSETRAQADIDNLTKQQTEIDRLKKVVADYEATKPDPTAIDLGVRVVRYALRACELPQTPAAAGATGGPAADTGGVAEVERDTQAVFDAASQDAAQLNAIQKAWPQ